ncbi:MAG: FkbM family methyltransferase [Cyclobacteriaceae bacterium]
MKKVEFYLKGLRAKFGIEVKVRKYPYGDKKRRIDLVRHYRINKIFDVGANKGQYGKLMRMLGYDKQIISFEPLTNAFSVLEKNSKLDKKWDAYNYGLGSRNQNLKINISKNSFSSSILDILESHTKPFPDAAYVSEELIEVKKLDDIFNNFYSEKDRIFVKIDTQGFEMEVLKGAAESLEKIKGIQIELSTMPLYKDQTLYFEIISFLNSNNFVLHSIEPGSTDFNGRLLQMDGLFFKE